ncbi:hypothetical protein IC611_13220 [Proteus mirabilis]
MPYNNTNYMAASEQYLATPQQEQSTKTSYGLVPSLSILVSKIILKHELLGY